MCHDASPGTCQEENQFVHEMWRFIVTSQKSTASSFLSSMQTDGGITAATRETSTHVCPSEFPRKGETEEWWRDHGSVASENSFEREIEPVLSAVHRDRLRDELLTYTFLKRIWANSSQLWKRFLRGEIKYHYPKRKMISII